MWYRIMLGLLDHGVLLFRYLTSRTYFFLQFHRTLHVVFKTRISTVGLLEWGVSRALWR